MRRRLSKSWSTSAGNSPESRQRPFLVKRDVPCLTNQASKRPILGQRYMVRWTRCSHKAGFLVVKSAWAHRIPMSLPFAASTDCQVTFQFRLCIFYSHVTGGRRRDRIQRWVRMRETFHVPYALRGRSVPSVNEQSGASRTKPVVHKDHLRRDFISAFITLRPFTPKWRVTHGETSGRFGHKGSKDCRRIVF